MERAEEPTPAERPDEYAHTVTVRSPDQAVLCCLSGLSMYAQRAVDPSRPPRSKWLHDPLRMTFGFTTAAGLELFIAKARQLLPPDTWFKESGA